MSKGEFDIKIGRLTRSRAYLNYCEEVYGYRMYLFNMTDKEQIDYLMEAVSVSERDTVLDLGCGSGSLLNLLAARYGCRVVGIDRLDEHVIGRSGNKFTYIRDDMERIFDYGVEPSVTLCVDSLYFCANPEKLIRELTRSEKNRIYIFHSEYLFDEAAADRSLLQSTKTAVGKILNDLGIPYRTIDYSENERRLYETSLKMLEKLQGAFAVEGNTDLFEQKLREDTMGQELYVKNLAARYLYIMDGAARPLATELSPRSGGLWL